MIEKLLAQAGLRLAATLNAIFATTEELALGDIRDWMVEADGAIQRVRVENKGV